MSKIKQCYTSNKYIYAAIGLKCKLSFMYYCSHYYHKLNEYHFTRVCVSGCLCVCVSGWCVFVWVGVCVFVWVGVCVFVCVWVSVCLCVCSRLLFATLKLLAHLIISCGSGKGYRPIFDIRWRYCFWITTLRINDQIVFHYTYHRSYVNTVCSS